MQKRKGEFREKEEFLSARGSASRLNNLDLLRGVAATAVLLQHLLEKADPIRFAPVLALAPGIFGVALFFLISGFVIPMSLTRGTSAREFIARRLFRIFPTYCAVLAAVVLLGLWGFAPWQAALRDGGLAGLLVNILLVQEYTDHPPLLGVSWTLSLEFVWYAIFLTSAVTLGHERIATLSLAASIGLLVLSALSILVEMRLPLGRLAMLNAAIFGYALFLAGRGAISPRMIRLALVFFILSVIATQAAAFGYFTHPRISLFNSLCGWLSAIAVFMVFQGKGELGASGLGLAASAIGWISYPLYLAHGPLISVWGAALGPTGMLVGVPILSVALAVLLRCTVELPGIALGRRFSGRFFHILPVGGSRS